MQNSKLLYILSLAVVCVHLVTSRRTYMSVRWIVPKAETLYKNTTDLKFKIATGSVVDFYRDCVTGTDGRHDYNISIAGAYAQMNGATIWADKNGNGKEDWAIATFSFEPPIKVEEPGRVYEGKHSHI